MTMRRARPVLPLILLGYALGGCAGGEEAEARAGLAGGAEPAAMASGAAAAEDPYMGRWQGTLHGISIEETPGERWTTELEIRLVNVRISAGDPPEVSAWAEGSYSTPQWESSVPDITKTYEVETPTTTGVMAGHLHRDPDGTWVALDRRELLPVVRTETITAPGSRWVGPAVDDLLGTQFDVLPPSPALSLDARREEDVLYLERTFDDELGVHRAEIEGVLYRVGQEKVTPPDRGDTIRTDEHTRKQVTLSEDVELVLNTNSKIVLDPEEQALLDLFYGEMRATVRGLSDEQLQIRTPQSVAAVRGTELEVRVQEDGTTTVRVIEGVVELSHRTHGGTVELRAGQRATVAPGAPLPTPEASELNPLSFWWR